MNEETILAILLGLFLLLLFVVGVASDVVAVAMLPVVSREGSVSGVTDFEPGLLDARTGRE